MVNKTVSFLLGAILWVGCASYTQEMGEVRSLYRNAAYERALARLEESDLKDSSVNRLLYQLERGMILDRLGREKDSRTAFLEASRLVDELYTVSVSKTAASFVISDSVADYEGEDYEKVAIHTMLALSFLESDDLKSARVEARKINSRLNEINSKYDANAKNRYAEDAFARYLSGMIFESLGEIDSAIIDYRAALQAYQESYKRYFSTTLPESLVRSLFAVLKQRRRNDEAKALAKEFPSLSLDSGGPGAAKTGELAVVHEVGHIAIKDSKEFLFGVGSQAVRFSFPTIVYQTRMFGRTGVEVNGTFVGGEVVQNMDAIASVTLDDRRGRMLLKQGARLLAKGQIVEQTRQIFGPLAAVAANVFTAATETADTRSWASLPAQLYVTRMRLPAGKQSIQIKSNGMLVEAMNVDIPERGLKIIRAPVQAR